MVEKAKEKWINVILDALKNTDESYGKSVLERCGRECFRDSGVLDKAKELGKSTKGMDDEAVIEMIQTEILGVDESVVRIYKEGGMIYLQYAKCLCDVAKTNHEYDHFLCECTKGFAKALMEAVFNRSAEVTILKTVLRGDDICLLAIRLV